MADLGRVKPIYGRWYWPFRQMEVGDEFHVSFQDREPEAVRQMATVRAAQLGIRLKTQKDDALGAMRITRIEFDTDNQKVLPKALSYEQFEPFMREMYGVSADAIRFDGAIRKGETVTHRFDPFDPELASLKRRGDDPRRLIEVAWLKHRYAVELNDDNVVIENIGGETLEAWQNARVAAMLE